MRGRLDSPLTCLQPKAAEPRWMGRKECERVNRKLIRPTLSEVQDQMGTRLQRKKPAPPEQTNAENFYYIKQMQARTPMVVVLDTGERIYSVIESFHKNWHKSH